MGELVIASTARSSIGRAVQDTFNNTKSPPRMEHALRHPVEPAQVDLAMGVPVPNYMPLEDVEM